ncbi:hypothetical protein [Couchioplanes azureus]|uniref:hypothetical protein n=1 Tax=Couchioplanes caeruleus TaxID=56438 RepID=UPI001670F788|nr:hypothetical protein [Couchioplanes caeruleus]GGQ86712.1 hypothetical protein GCM10010166_66070 [Couchioplanes caeruleus subsp. azureus]
MSRCAEEPTDHITAMIQRLHAEWTTFHADSGDPDPVLSLLTELAAQRDLTDRCIRAVLAYARIRPPRPYPLTVLADTVGMSFSGVRTAFRQDDITAVRNALLTPPGEA